jgi:hypothetical protein
MLLRSVLLAAVGIVALAGSTQASTVATFADPSPDATTPVFSYNAATGVFSGGWSGTGLNLLTPGVPAADFNDATFVLSPLSTVLSLGGVSFMSGGNVRFFDSSANEIFRIDFASSTLTQSLSLGASDFVGSGVVFSGSIIPSGYIVSDEAFAFSFANPTASLPTGSYTVTSSFTSSATLLVPAPGAAALAGFGGLALARRRRR